MTRFSGHTGVLGATLITALAFMLVWLGLFIVESLSRPSNISTPEFVTLYMTETGVVTADDEPISVPLRADPLYDYKDPAVETGDDLSVGVFEVYFDHDGSDTPLAVFFSSRYELEEVRLNDRLLKAQSPTDPQGTLSGYGPTAFVFPDEFLVEGRNIIRIRSFGFTYKSLPLFYIGDAGKILRTVAWGEFFSFDLVVAASAMMIFVILMCILVDWPREDRSRIRLLIWLMVSWSLRNFSILGVFDALPLPLLRMTTYMLSYLPLVVIAHFAIVWTNQSNTRLMKRILAGLYAVIVLVPAAVVLLGVRRIQGVSIPWAMDNVLTLSLTAFALVLFFRYLAKGARNDRVEVAIFLICIFSLLIDKIDNIFHIWVPFSDKLFLTFYFAPLCGLLLGLGMCASIAAQATRARRTVINVNQTLEARLAERETEIRQQAKSRAIVEERRRIMQDMHDGLGARLSGIILRTRSHSLPYEEVPAAVQGSLDELRLIIDSLDSAGDTLAIALGAYRERIESQFSAANMSLFWNIDQRATRVEYSANTVLQIFRILQEASSNIIHHSQASCVEVSLLLNEGASKEAYPYIITVADDGKGLEEAATRQNGKGLTSMQSRAAHIEGRIDIQRRRSGGTQVKLFLPRNIRETPK